MKYLILNVVTNSGISKTSQKPYSMSRALVGVPFQDVDTSNFQAHGFGFSAVELSISSSFSTAFINQFNSLFKGTPIEIDLETSLDREGKNIIVGFSTPEKKAF